MQQQINTNHYHSNNNDAIMQVTESWGVSVVSGEQSEPVISRLVDWQIGRLADW
jgi:hypothetical protein